MRVAVLSDIHANLTALEAVIADLPTTTPDLVLHGGDLMAGGPRPAEVIDRIREMKVDEILGALDLAIPGAIPTGARASAELMPPGCRESARRTTRTASAIRSPRPGRPDPRTSRRTTARRAICRHRLPAARRVPIRSPRA